MEIRGWDKMNWVPGFFSSYWKRRCLVVEDRMDALEAQICLLRGFTPLTRDEIADHNRRVLGAEFHSEVKS
jgi:hypothetical protein